jgi:hypothetical protein
MSTRSVAQQTAAVRPTTVAFMAGALGVEPPVFTTQPPEGAREPVPVGFQPSAPQAQPAHPRTAGAQPDVDPVSIANKDPTGTAAYIMLSVIAGAQQCLPPPPPQLPAAKADDSTFALNQVLTMMESVL